MCCVSQNESMTFTTRHKTKLATKSCCATCRSSEAKLHAQARLSCSALPSDHLFARNARKQRPYWDPAKPLIKKSWDSVTEVINKVAILRTTKKTPVKILTTVLSKSMNLQVSIVSSHPPRPLISRVVLVPRRKPKKLVTCAAGMPHEP